MKRAALALDLGAQEEGDVVRFGIVDSDGIAHEFLCHHDTFKELANVLLQVQFNAAKIRHDLGKPTVPLPKPGIVRGFVLSQLAILPGRDGLPHLTVQMTDSSTLSVKMTRNDLIHLRDIFGKAVDQFPEGNAE